MRFQVRSILRLLVLLALLTLLFVILYNNGLADTKVLSAMVRAPTNCVSKTTRNISNSVNTITFEDVPGTSKADVRLVIATYMRSGSTLVGEFFNIHKQVFYFFEPLWSIQKRYLSGEPVFFFDKDERAPNTNGFFGEDSMSVDIIGTSLNCSFLSIDPRTLTQWTLYRSLAPGSYLRCKEKSPGVFGILRCLPILRRTCMAARVTVVKTIRFSLKQAEKLMKVDPRVKVIHLLRDPRATFSSQAEMGEFPLKDVGNFSKQFCQRILQDLEDAQRMKGMHPGRFLTVRYEDVAWEPVTSATRLLAFAGLHLDEELRQTVWNMTSAGLKDDCCYCTTRNNSRATAAAWRLKRDFDFFSKVDASCVGIYKLLGYLPLATEAHLRNLSVPFYLDSEQVRGLW
ncbi:carbohydrate sulfotransferase 6-like [Pomacea canaliculata]|nr:carbohydrate sulfotransferase 6-like [Pomacea canaliculata]